MSIVVPVAGWMDWDQVDSAQSAGGPSEERAGPGPARSTLAKLSPACRLNWAVLDEPGKAGYWHDPVQSRNHIICTWTMECLRKKKRMALPFDASSKFQL